MSDVQSQPADREAEPSGDMSEQDKRSVSERSAGSPKVIHEVVRLEGDEELDRPLPSLLFSGFAAGVALSQRRGKGADGFTAAVHRPPPN